ncbi:MAG: hypothetical protein AAGD18_08900 [Actinomycetota bacterium]
MLSCRTPFRLLAVTFALTVCATACSSSDEDADGATASTTTAEPTAVTEAATSSTSTPEAAPTTVAGIPPLFAGERVVAIGSNVWPIVGDLLALGVTPVAIYSQLGNQEQPDYLTEAYGDVLADVPVTLVSLTELNPEELATLDADRVVMPAFFEAVIGGNPIFTELLGDGAVYVEVQDWRSSLGTIAEAGGIDADVAIADLEAVYETRVAEIAASLDYDPAEVVFNTFQWNEDGTYLAAFSELPIVQIVSELGFQLHPSLGATGPTPPQSQETVTDMDADLVFVQVRNVDFDSLPDDPLWSTTSVAATGNVFERFQFGQQAGWLETLELLDQLAEELPRYSPS